LATYIMDLAEQDPEAFGMSLAYAPDVRAEQQFIADNLDENDDFRSPDAGNVRNQPHARLATLRAVDAVDDPAANPAGLFHARQDVPMMGDALLSFLFGLSDVVPPELAALAARYGFDDVIPELVQEWFQGLLTRHGVQIVGRGPGGTRGELAEIARQIEEHITDGPTRPRRDRARAGAGVALTQRNDTDVASGTVPPADSNCEHGGFIEMPQTITFGRSASEKLNECLADAVFLGEADAFGIPPERQAAAREFGGLRLQGLARAVLGRSGQRAPDNPDRLFATAVTTNTFGYVLSTIMGRSLARGYQEFTSTLRLWAGEREAPDFRTRTDVRMGEFAAPEKINDGGELPHDTIGDSAETYNAETYGKTFTLTRKTWINDDLGALRDWPRKLGRAMARNIDQIGYDLLVSAAGVGPTMGEDSLALFDTTRATPNYQTGAGTVLGDTGLADGKKLMRKLKHGDVFINVIPRILLVPPELEHTAMKLVQSQELMIGSDSSATVFPTKNVHQGTLAPVVEPRLSAATNGTTAWYLIADPLQAESLVVVYLSGNRNPVIEQVNPVGILGLGWRAYHDVGVAFVDWRGIVRSKGA